MRLQCVYHEEWLTGARPRNLGMRLQCVYHEEWLTGARPRSLGMRLQCVYREEWLRPRSLGMRLQCVYHEEWLRPRSLGMRLQCVYQEPGNEATVCVSRGMAYRRQALSVGDAKEHGIEEHWQEVNCAEKKAAASSGEQDPADSNC